MQHHSRQMVTWCVFVPFDITCGFCIIILTPFPSCSLFFIHPSFPVVPLLSSIHSGSIAQMCLSFHTFPLLSFLRL